MQNTMNYPRQFRDKFGSTRRWFVFEPGGDVWIRLYPDLGIQNVGMIMNESEFSTESEITDEPLPELFISDDFTDEWELRDGKPARIYPHPMN